MNIEADAMALGPNGPFREDAEFRRVEALDAAGKRQPCQQAKSAFVARFSHRRDDVRLANLCAR